MSAALLKRAIERQNRTWAQMTEIRDRATAESRDMTAEERASWDQAEKDLSEASSDIERFERAAKLDSVDRDRAPDLGGTDDRSAPSDQERRYAEAFGRYLQRGMERLSADDQALLAGNEVDLRAQATGSDTAGGYTVPTGFRNTLVETMKAFGGIAGLAETITTETGADLPWVTNDDTNNEGEILGENDTVGEQDVNFGGRKLKAHIFSSKMVKVPRNLLQDNAFDLESWLPRKLGERIGRRAARAWISGTGIDEPEGINTNITVGKTGANGQTTSVIYNDLIDLEHSVDPAYRGPNSRFVWHDQTLKVVRKLVDGDGRPLWVPVPVAGMPATVNGRPYEIDNSMPVPAASAKSIVFGDIRAGYVIRLVLGVQTLRLSERYAEKLQIAFLSFMRADGMVQDPSAIRGYQHPAS
jgi:HK97 family phage major capsid protein